MPLRLTVCSQTARGQVERTDATSIVFDSPRIVVGRGDGADLRLPDASVSQRHATIRQRGSEYLLTDEGSTNGTRLGAVRLAPNTARVIRNGDALRFGRVSVVFSVEGVPATTNPRKRAEDLALELVENALGALGEDPRPQVEIVAGPDQGKVLKLDSEISYVLGRSADCAIHLEDQGASRRHVSLERRGSAVFVVDLGSKAGVALGDRQLHRQEAVWGVEQVLRFGENEAVLRLPATDALAEIEGEPDEKVRASDLLAADATQLPTEVVAEDLSPTATVEQGEDDPPRSKHGTPMKGRFGSAELAVTLLAFGVLAMSAAGYVVLLR